jgi:outer membrane protein OmpA-like peptidoglycan-associated protein
MYNKNAIKNTYMKLLTCILLLTFTWFYSFAQDKNLVVNPGFEDYKVCPESHNPENQSHAIIPGWTYPTFAAPDYFNRCSPHDAGVPVNFAGTSEPNNGNGYAGAILSGTFEGRREYIQGELKKPMEAGKKYCVKFYYRLASGSRFAVDQLSVYFARDKILKDGIVALGVKPQLNNIDGLFLDNVEDWEQICYVYTAEGNEKHFIIGNFKNYDNTNYVVTDKNIVNLRNKAYAYYYFDDVDISQLDNCQDCPCVQHDFETRIVDTFYTGGRDPVTGQVKRIINDGYIKIGILGGTPPYKVKWSNNSTGPEIRNLPGGVYTYVASDNNNCLSTGTVTFVEPRIVKDEFVEGLKNIEEGSAIVLENIFFEFNKTDLLPESYLELDKIADFMIENNINRIEISGHTDSEGSDAYNQKLSEGRAQAVVNYLISRGVHPVSMEAVGYGKTRPIDTNLTEEGRARNRRVEFMLVKR